MIIKAWRDEISLMEDNIPAVSCYYSIFRVKGSARLKPKISLPCYYVTQEGDSGEHELSIREDVKKICRYRTRRTSEGSSVSRNVRVWRIYGKKGVNVPFHSVYRRAKRDELIIDFCETFLPTFAIYR